MKIQKLNCTDSKIETLRKINAMADAIEDGGGQGGMGLPIGSIFQAIRTDIPEGSLRIDGTEYTTGFDDFVQNYLATGKIISKSLDEWQTEYTMTDGNVGFFGYDEATGAFKVPCIQSGTFLAQAIASGDFGSFLNSELKSHTHTQAAHTHSWSGTTSSSGAHTHSTTSAGGHTHGVYTNGTAESGSSFGLQNTRTSGISGGDNANTQTYVTKLAKNSAQLLQTAGAHTHTAQSAGAHTHTVSGTTGSATPTINATGGSDTYPKHIRYPFFVVVSNVAAEQPSQADWDNFVGNLDNKLNKSLSNIDEIGQAKFDAIDNKKVNKAGDTMTGILTIRKPKASINVTDPDIFFDKAHSTSETRQSVLFMEGNNNWIGQVGIEKYNDNKNCAKLQTRCADGSSAPAVRVYGYADGRTGMTFPMCTTKATTTSSARNDLVAVVTQNYVNGTSWYRVWSDGWIEQGGYITRGSATGGTVTLLKAFSNTNYAITMAGSNCTVYWQLNWHTKYTGSFTWGYTGGTDGGSSGGNWYACGY